MQFLVTLRNALPIRPTGRSLRRLRLPGIGLLAVLLVPSLGASQTISGVLVDRDSSQPIPLGLVMLYTEAGDSLTATVTDESGRFLLGDDEPGSFVLRAAAFGYREAMEGVFDLGAGGGIRVEFRLAPAPLPIDEIAVSIDRPVLDHHLVRNGFVRRLQRGLGVFVTPYDVERSLARSTESLLSGTPSIRVGTVVSRQGGVGLPSPHLGETVQIMAPGLGWCDPVVYVDGIRSHYDPSQGFTLSTLANIGDIDAMEVYRSAAELPVEFAAGDVTRCGIVVMWTKRGIVTETSTEAIASSATGVSGAGAAGDLPDVGKTGPPPSSGETVRLQLSDTSPVPGLPSLWQGTFLSAGDVALAAHDPATGRPISIPVVSIEEIQVSRRRPAADAYRRGLIWGTVAGVGSAGFLRGLCEFTCRGGGDAHAVALPGIIIGSLVAVLVTARGPGMEWVSTSPN